MAAVPPIKLKITRTVTLPDRLRLDRYARTPELGPKILFFSGGSALNPISRELTRYTHNSIHLVTPFDSGGSSAKLRQAFKMPAVGDLRNRLMALADKSVLGNPEIIKLFSYRLPARDANEQLARRLKRMIAGSDKMVARVPDPMRKIIRTHLGFFFEQMPEDFDLRGASIGNLVLTGGYLNNGRKLDPVVYIFGKLAEVRGVVRTILNKNLHLAAELEQGEIVVGQHLITGREVPPLTTPIKRVFLTDSTRDPKPARTEVRQKILDLISQAELICFPIGSFFSSLIANLLPGKVAAAVYANGCPKVFLPNTGVDKELLGYDLKKQTETLVSYLTNKLPQEQKPDKPLDIILLDKKNHDHSQVEDLRSLNSFGFEIVDADLHSESSKPCLDPRKVTEILASLV